MKGEALAGRRNPWLLFIFFAVVAAHMVAESAHWTAIAFLTKPLIVLSLVGHYVSTARSKSIAFLFALAFCCIGDSLLLFQSGKELFFMLGLGSFLIGHVFYIVSFRQHREVLPQAPPVGTQRIRLAFPVLLAGSGLIVVLFPALGGLKIPVLIYALVLTAMVVSAIFRMGRTNAKSFWLVAAGGVLFMISDSLLAINKFLTPVTNASLWIMLSYCAAQFLLVQGILEHRGKN